MKVSTDIPSNIIAELLSGCGQPLKSKTVETQKTGFVFEKEGGGETYEKDEAAKDENDKPKKVMIDCPKGTLVGKQGEETIKKVPKRFKKTKVEKVDGKNKKVPDMKTETVYSDDYNDLDDDQKQILKDALIKCHNDYLNIKNLKPKVKF